MRPNLLMLLPPVIFLALAGLFYVGMYREDPEGLPSTFVGREAPGLPEDGLPGYEKLTPGMLRDGGVSVVNFWASWCPPCRAEHPTLLRMAEDGIEVNGVNFKDEAKQALKYLKDEGSPFTGLGFDPKGRTALDWGVTAPPETFIVAGDGTVLFRFAGPLVGSDYEQRFLPALNEALGRQGGGES